MACIILGISAFFHDSAAALIIDGKIVAAAQEERFSRIKNDASFPIRAISYVLQEAAIGADELYAVAFYEKPLLKFERLLETYHAFAPKGVASFLKAMPIWLKDKLFLKKRIHQHLKELGILKVPLYFPEHHLSHAASAFFPSPFEKATILTLDGVGEWANMTIGLGEGNQIKILKEQHFPHSVGLLYSAFTYYLGFEVNSGEYKVMGLAAYGNPQAEETRLFIQKIKKELVDIREDGSILLHMTYFRFATHLTMTHDKNWSALFQVPRRKSEEKLKQVHANLSFAIQQVLEEIVLKLAETAVQLTKNPNLVMAGGVALNSVANGKLLDVSSIKRLWVQPAAGDAGGALGAALAVWHIHENKERTLQLPDAMSGAYLGPSFTQNSILDISKKYDNLSYVYVEQEQEVLEKTVTALTEGKVVGWFQGRMEFGPRALGNRSILGDPRNPDMQKRINRNIKFRESFRPFAPSVMIEDANSYFELNGPSPYMLLVRQINQERIKANNKSEVLSLTDRLSGIRSDIPAVTHIDCSARIQTVSRKTNPLFWRLLQAFKQRTGYGLLINTSFNVKDEPIVCTPSDALNCFIQTGMDVLVMGQTIYAKDDKEKSKQANDNFDTDQDHNGSKNKP